MIIDDIIEKYGLPRKYCSCPSCGRVYGHHRTLVCKNCEECSKCCSCENNDFVKPDDFLKNY